MTGFAWFPETLIPAGAPPPPGTGPTIYAPRAALAEIDRVELWTDVEANGGVLLGPVAQYFGLSETAKVDGEHSLALRVAMDHPIVRLHDTPITDFNLRVNQVLRLVKAAGTFANGGITEHRISELTRSNQRGARTRSVVARSIFQDLALRGLICRTTADGASTPSFEALSLPMEDHIRAFLLPALVEAGQPFWDVGSMPHTLPVDMVYDRDTPLSALRKLLLVGVVGVASGNLELYVEAAAGQYLIHIVEQVGATALPVTVRSRRNLIDLGFTERGEDQATRVYVFGNPDPDGQRPSLGLGVWLTGTIVDTFGGVSGNYSIQLLDAAGGPGPIKFVNQFVPVVVIDDPDTPIIEAPPNYVLKYDGFDKQYSIIGSDPALQTVIVQAPGPPPTGSNRVRIVADALGRENLYVEDPDSVLKYGVRVATLDRPDIPGTDNLVPNPFGRIWPASSPLPTGWSIPSGTAVDPIVSRETSPLYVEHGGQAVRIRWPAAAAYDRGLALPVTLIPLRAQGFLSFLARIVTLSGRVSVNLVIDRNPLDYNGNPSPFFPYTSGNSRRYYTPAASGTLAPSENDVTLPLVTNIQLNTAEDLGIAAAWLLTKYPLYGGTAYIYLIPPWDEPGPIECIVIGGQITNTSEQMPLLEGNGGTRLHQIANARVGLYRTPSPTVSVNLLDLAMADGVKFPFTPLQLGGAIVLEDPDSDVQSVQTRIVGWTKDWQHRTMPSLELSNARSDMTAILASRQRPGRHPVRPVPPGTRGLSFTP